MLAAMRRYLPAFLLLLAGIAPFPLAGCDMLNKLKGGGDGGLDAAALITVLPDAAVAPAVPTDVTADAAPLPAATTTTIAPVVPTVHPIVTDAGVKLDAGAAKIDAGPGPAPAPTPTLRIPTNLFDAGGIKFDAGGFKPPWVK